MDFYNFFVSIYNNFLSLFPGPLQWLITVIVIIALIGAFVALIRHDALFLILLIILLPFIAPVLQRLFTDIYNFFLYLIHVAGATAPPG